MKRAFLLPRKLLWPGILGQLLGIVVLLGLPALAAAQSVGGPAADSGSAIARPVVPLAADSSSAARSARVEAAYLTLGHINATARSLANTADITTQLPGVETNLHTIYNNLTQFGAVVSARQLLTFRVLLKDMRQDLTAWRAALIQSGHQLDTMQLQLAGLRQQLGPPSADDQVPGDTVLTQTLASIRRKQQRTALLVQQQQRTLQTLQNRVSGNYIHLLEQEDILSEQFRKLGISSLQPDAQPLSRAVAADTTQQARLGEKLQRAYAGQQQLLAYYFSQHSGGWGWLLVIGALFFWWVFRNFRQASQVAPEKALDHRALIQLRPFPVTGTLVVMLSLAPYFSLQAPAGYLDLLQLLVLLMLTWHLGRTWPRRLYFWWLGFVAILVAQNALLAGPLPGPGLRWVLIGCNLVAAGLGIRWGRRARQAPELNWFVGPVLFLYAGLQVAAIISNLTGYLSLAKLLTSTAANSLLQIIALSTLIDLLTQALNLQMQRIRLSNGVSSRFNFDVIERHSTTLLSVVAVGLWLMAFFTNLNLYALVGGAVKYLLITPWEVGTVSISLLNVLLFGLVIFLTVQAQKFVGYFYGDADDDEFNPRLDRKGSKQLIIRLVVFGIGATLAAAVSGLPVDRIALVFGALSVGIGLGLQNIVNNLVSGIILIFERPFQIGDYIEVAGKTGRVKDIGVRSSKLISMAGSEIIVPNGDLLSNHVINWTLSNNHMRVSLDLKLAATTDLEHARELISEEVLASRNVLQQVEPEILLRGIAGQVYDLQVQFWINNIRHEQQLKSEILASIYKRFGGEGILLN
ncbi:mechanosensitive ion channel family protein [Hymenobacter monticola]|uniref:Mechanosensitive ion channel n=1 Tax=Hymenobacter monticola TaxID=1705399 RepID=A0ABY4BBJ0_9BACT|nr:mechanosensitive ion channel domain-containing protein [Hymenobacter monticola]UOE36513.1 mechanosensitive ion channel [Hymenobacter monticola]